MITSLHSSQPKLLLCLLIISGALPPAANAGWKIQFNGSGSSPVIAAGILYIGSADGLVYALDARTGETKWRFQTGASLAPSTSGPQVITVPRGNSLADQIAAGMNAAEKQRAAGIRRVDMTPAVANGTVFIGAGDHSFYAIDALTGKKKWSYEAGAGMASNNNTSRPMPAAILNNGTAYLATDEGLHALDMSTGDRRWLSATLRQMPARQVSNVIHLKRPPEGMVLAEGAVFATAWLSSEPEQSVLYAVAAESGTTTWVTTLDGIYITAPVAANGLVLVATHSSVLSSASYATLYAINAGDGQVRWKLRADSSSPLLQLLVANRTILCSTDKGGLFAADLETGQRVWSFSTAGMPSPLSTDDQHVYVITHKGSVWIKGTLHALALTTGQEKWSQQLSGGGYGSLAHDGVVYAGESPLHAIDALTGRKLWSLKGTRPASVPVISGDRIFLTSETITYFGTSQVDQGYLQAIDARTGKP